MAVNNNTSSRRLHAGCSNTRIKWGGIYFWRKLMTSWNLMKAATYTKHLWGISLAFVQLFISEFSSIFALSLEASCCLLEEQKIFFSHFTFQKPKSKPINHQIDLALFWFEPGFIYVFSFYRKFIFFSSLDRKLVFPLFHLFHCRKAVDLFLGTI